MSSFSVPAPRESGFFERILRAYRHAAVALKIPGNIYALVDRIRGRFSAVTASRHAVGDERCDALDRMIGVINADPDLASLHRHVGDFSIIPRVFPDSPSAGRGDNLIFGAEGLKLYVWDDYSGERRMVKAQAASIPYPLTADGLRNEIALHTSRRAFVAWVADDAIEKMGGR